MRRRTIAGLMLAAGLAASGASAQTFPSKQITIVVPFTAGGPTDLSNLGLLCPLHHTEVHLGLWVVTDDRGLPVVLSPVRAALHGDADAGAPVNIARVISTAAVNAAGQRIAVVDMKTSCSRGLLESSPIAAARRTADHRVRSVHQHGVRTAGP